MAIIAAAGTLAGLSGLRADVRLLAFVIAAGLILSISDSFVNAGRRRHAALILTLVFTIFFLRAALESLALSSKEAEEFYEDYVVTVPGQFDYGTYLKGLGIKNREEYEAYMNDEAGSDPLSKAALAVRSYISTRLDSYMSEEDAGIYKAILIGDKSELSDDIQDLYQAAGISHLLAISGLHVSIIGGGLFKFLKDRLKMRRARAALFSSLFLCFYAFICGMGSSVVRASVMLALSFFALVRMRVYDMRTAVAVSFMILLLMHPYRVLSSGFQLSFGAVAAIAFVSDEMTRGIEKRIKLMRHVPTRYTSRMDRLSPAVRTVLMSLSIQLTTLPILAWHYYTFPLYGFFLNFIVIPLMGFVLLSGVALIGFAFIADIASLISPALMSLLSVPAFLSAAPGHYILKLYSLCSELSARLPFSTLVTGRPSLYLIIVYFAVLFLALIILSHPEAGILNHPAAGLLHFSGMLPRSFPRLQNQRLAIIAFFAVLLLNAAFLRYYEPHSFYVMALDAGQGDSFIIKSGNMYISIDGGSSSNLRFGERALEPYLLSHRITDIDMMIISHADSDHTSGIKYLLESSDNVSVERLCLPSAAISSEDYDELKELFIAAGGDESGIYYLRDLSRLLVSGDTSLSVIYAGNADAADANRHSDVILLEKGDDFSMLFTGDAGIEDEPMIISLYEEARASGLSRTDSITVLKAGHHGSRTSSSEELLQALSPRVVLLSYGEGNSYGHPHEEVLERMSALGIAIVSTAENGSLLITEDSITPAR